MIRLDVNPPGGAYPILIGKNALENCTEDLASVCPARRAAVVSDETVWEMHGERLARALRGLEVEFVQILILPGETSKSLEALERVYSELASFGLKRSEPVIAFGGGVVGDLAGFAAATWMRGVPLVQIPTTLLSQVDSSVGGKVAVNLREGKNLVGSFYQPRLVIADTELLESLPPREWKSGLAEVVKYAAIGEKELEPILLGGNIRQRLAEIVRLCCRCKAGYVERDERDTGERMFLNFGHSFAHAIEKHHNYEKYNHGEAVAIGMALAARAGIALGVSAPDTYDRITELMRALELNYGLQDDIAELIPLMAGDKKNAGKSLTLVLLEKVGSPLAYRIGMDELLRVFERTI